MLHPAVNVPPRSKLWVSRDTRPVLV